MVRTREPCPVCGESTLDLTVVRGRQLPTGGRAADTVTGVTCANLCHTKPEWALHSAELEALKMRHD